MHTNTTKQINKANKRLKDRARCAMVSKEEIEATKKMEIKQHGYYNNK